MLPAVARVLVSTLTAALVVGLCATGAEARGVSRVSGVALLAQDWDNAKLVVRWNAKKGATRYAMRVASTRSRLPGSPVVRTRTAEGTSTRELRRDQGYYVQVRAIRKYARGPWSHAQRVAFTPPGEGVSVPNPPAGPVAPAAGAGSTLFGFWAGADRVGAGQGTRANYDRVSSYLGAPKVYRMFFPGSPGTNFVGSNADYGPPVVVSFKFKPQEVVTGKWDATMRSWFNSIPSSRQVWWSYFHEPENDIEAGSYTFAQYRAAWEHLIALAPKRANLHPTLILMRYSLSLPTKRPIQNYVTKGLEVLCWDSYLTGGLTIKKVVEEPAAVSAKFGLDFAIGETAAKDPAKVNQFVKDLIPAAKTAQAKFVTWFETDKSGLGVNEADWRMRPHSAAVSTWRQ